MIQSSHTFDYVVINVKMKLMSNNQSIVSIGLLDSAHARLDVKAKGESH